MPTQQITNGNASVLDAGAPSDDELQLRELAVKQLERKRRFGCTRSRTRPRALC